MKALFYTILGLALAGLTSCGNLTEEITIREDGSGEYVVYSNMIPMIPKMMTTMGAVMDTTHKELDSAAIEAKIWKEFPEDVDSTFSFEKLGAKVGGKMEGSEELQKLPGKIEGFMQGGRNKGYMNIGMRYSFNHTKDLKKFFNYLEKAQNPKKEKDKDEENLPKTLAFLTNMSSSTTYKFKKNYISRKTTASQSLSEISEGQELTAIIKLLSQGKIRTVVTLPRKIKEVSGENMVELKDNTVAFEYSFTELLADSIKTDFRIEMEK